MHQKTLTVLLALVVSCGLHATNYQICIYGGSSAGIVAAYSAAQMGKNVLIIEPSGHWGGLTTGGLGYTDIGNKQVVTGLAKQFYRKLGKHYGSLEQWVFEPSIASGILLEYLKHPRITRRSNTQLLTVNKTNNRISQITVVTASGKQEHVRAQYFIDATYEGDLMAKAGVSYVVGRESNATYQEDYNGVQLMKNHQFMDGIDPYLIKGDSTSGLLWGISEGKLAPAGSGDSLVQAYNYRICLTSDPRNLIPITRPSGYDSTRYALLLRLMEKQPEKQSLNHYFIWSKMPNSKTDVNNRGGFSTDMIGANHRYPKAGYKERAEIVREHEAYTKGLLYFIGHDSRVPEKLRKEMLKWGYPKDEYVDNGHWSPQLYVREARRMVGAYVATQADCEGKTVVSDGVAMAAYTMDSHNCQRIVVYKNGQAMVKNEGNVEIKAGGPYPISYRSLVPKPTEVVNLLVPICLSASHIAYGSIRMEPVFMVVGQASGIAASLALDQKNGSVQAVNPQEIRRIMEENPYMDHSVPDILVDNTCEKVMHSAGWKLVKSNTGYGGSYAESSSEDSTAYFSFPARVKHAGTYDLYVYQHADPKQSPCLRLEISAGGQKERKELKLSDMKVEGQTKGAWTKVGTYRLSSGENAEVKLASAGTGNMRADAVLWVPVP